MREVFMSRKDEDGNACTFDSVKWALETHVKIADNPEYNSLILQGNEDAPTRIEFYESESPTIGDSPAYVWQPVAPAAPAGCDACQMLNINGINCHETGCPNAWRTKPIPCFECGCEFQPDERGQRTCNDCVQGMRDE